MSFDLTGKYISSSYQRLYINDDAITDGTGSIISSLDFNAPFTSSAISTERYISTTGSAIFNSTASFTVTEEKTVEIFDHLSSYNAPAGALFASGGALYFASTEHTGDLDKDYCETTSNVIYTAVSSSNYVDKITTPSCLTFFKYIDIYTNPPLRDGQDITAFVSYSLDISAIRNLSDLSEAGNVTASVNITSSTACTYLEDFSYDFSATGPDTFGETVPLGLSFLTSSQGSFGIQLLSGSEQFITASVSGNKSILAAWGGIRMCVYSSSVAPTTNPGANLTNKSSVSTVSSSINLDMTSRYLLNVVPYEIEPYITGSGAAFTNFFNDSVSINTNGQYYWGFEDVDYELTTVNTLSPTDTTSRTDILPIGTTEVDVLFTRCENPYRDKGLNLEDVDV